MIFTFFCLRNLISRRECQDKINFRGMYTPTALNILCCMRCYIYGISCCWKVGSGCFRFCSVALDSASSWRC